MMALVTVATLLGVAMGDVPTSAPTYAPSPTGTSAVLSVFFDGDIGSISLVEENDICDDVFDSVSSMFDPPLEATDVESCMVYDDTSISVTFRFFSESVTTSTVCTGADAIADTTVEVSTSVGTFNSTDASCSTLGAIAFTELSPAGCCRNATDGRGTNTEYVLDTTREECEQMCSDTFSCTGYEYDQNEKCELHRTDDFNHTSDDSFCACVEKVNDFGVPGDVGFGLVGDGGSCEGAQGPFVSTTHDLGMCIRLCKEGPNCVGVVFNTETNECDRRQDSSDVVTADGNPDFVCYRNDATFVSPTTTTAPTPAPTAAGITIDESPEFIVKPPAEQTVLPLVVTYTASERVRIIITVKTLGGTSGVVSSVTDGDGGSVMDLDPQGTIDIKVTIGSWASAGDYKAQAYLLPAGGTWGERFAMSEPVEFAITDA